MKTKILLVTAMMFASLFLAAVVPVEAELSPDKYAMTKYDPIDDVIRFRTGGDFKNSYHSNVDIKKMTSSYVANVIGSDEIQFTMTVSGTIQNSDSYKYAFAADIDGDIYIFAAYYQGAAVGFKFGANELILPPFITASGAGSNTLTINIDITEIESHSQKFEFTGGAVYSVGDYERYIDLAPDKLILITEPSDHSTVDGGVTVKGEIRESMDNKPGTDVKISIDSGPLQSVTGSDSWTYPTGPLSDGEHTIYVEVEGAGLDNANDEITITVDSNTAEYYQFDKEPSPNINSMYNYSAIVDADINGIEIPLSTETGTVIKGIETITVDGKDYDVYRVENHGEGGQDLGYVSFSNTVDKTTWRTMEGFKIIQERTNATNEATLRETTTTDTTTTYDPPYETHREFSVTVGFDNRWFLDTDAHSESTTTVGGDTTTNPPYDESLDYTGECLYRMESKKVHGNTFQDIYVIRSYLESPGVSIVEYYSPDLGVPVQIDTYDASRNLLISLGLENWDIPLYSIIIDEVTFDPSEPKANSENKITIRLRNLGNEAASNIGITVEDGDKTVAEETISSIAVDGTEEITVKWKPKAEGSHTIKISAYAGGSDLDEKSIDIEVLPGGEDGTSFPLVLLPIVIIIAIVAIVAAVFLLKRRRASEGEVAEGEAVRAEAEAPSVVVAEAEPEPVVTQTAPTTTQEITENIQCPSCKQAFTVKYESKPVKVKCPSCGTEGVLK